jgi:hypothetical protein
MLDRPVSKGRKCCTVSTVTASNYPSQVASGEIHMKIILSDRDKNCQAGLGSKSLHQKNKERARSLDGISQTFRGWFSKQDRNAAFARIGQSFSGETAKTKPFHQAKSNDPCSHFAFEFDRMDINKECLLSPTELHSALL